MKRIALSLLAISFFCTLVVSAYHFKGEREFWVNAAVAFAVFLITALMFGGKK